MALRALASRSATSGAVVTAVVAGRPASLAIPAAAAKQLQQRRAVSVVVASATANSSAFLMFCLCFAGFRGAFGSQLQSLRDLVENLYALEKGQEQQKGT